jgi:SDR family mycofactocin-dependent oxidoreductase
VNRVAVVTGAARGIGAATVTQLASAGWNIIAVDRCQNDPRLPYALGTEAELAAVAARARAAGPPGAGVMTVIGDAGDSAVMTRATRTAEAEFGGVDAIIAIAGVIAGGVPIWEMPIEQQDAVLDADLRAVLIAARVGIPALLRRPEPRSGRFIAVASAAATRGLPLLAVYCAAKSGVTGLIRALAAELRGSGITANAISPGSTATPILDESARLYHLESAEMFSGQHPIERLISPEEIAGTITWIAGETTAALTGASIPVDGGLSL